MVKKIREKNIEVINNFLNYNYLSLLKKYYYKNNKKIYLKDFGRKDDSYILLSDEKITFQEKINTFGDENYADVYKKVVEELYFPKIFSINNWKIWTFKATNRNFIFYLKKIPIVLKKKIIFII